MRKIYNINLKDCERNQNISDQGIKEPFFGFDNLRQELPEPQRFWFEWKTWKSEIVLDQGPYMSKRSGNAKIMVWYGLVRMARMACT